MVQEHINPVFKLRREELEEKLGLNLRRNGPFDYIVPPTALKEITTIALLDQSEVGKILQRVQLKGRELYPYAQAHFDIYDISPKALRIGQSFVLERKVLDLCTFEENFERFSLPGLAHLTPVLMYGTNVEREHCGAIYVPPIVEVHEGKYVLLDGIHRSYLAKSIGSTMTYVVVSNVDTPLPFEGQCWKYARQMSEKPPIQERYVNLDINKFRDLSSVGIDG